MNSNIDFHPGHYYLIKHLKGCVDPAYRRKLIVLGLFPGARFLIIRVTPWGGPIQLEVQGSLLSLRRHELCSLFALEPCPNDRKIS